MSPTHASCRQHVLQGLTCRLLFCCRSALRGSMAGHVSRLATLQESSSTSSSLDGCSLPQLPQQQLQQLRAASLDGCSDDQQTCSSFAVHTSNSNSLAAGAAAGGFDRAFFRPMSGRLGSPLAKSLPQLQRQGSVDAAAADVSGGVARGMRSAWQGEQAGQLQLQQANPSASAAIAAPAVPASGSWTPSLSSMRHHSAPLLGAQRDRRLSGERVSTPSSSADVPSGRPGGAKAVNFQRVLSRSSSQMTVGGAAGSSSAMAGKPHLAEVVM
jgi:hypothetical protein